MVFLRALSVVAFVGQMLLAFRANVDIGRIVDGATPLLLAAENSHRAVVEVRILDGRK